MFTLTFVNYAVLHTTRSMWSSATKDIENMYEGFDTNNIALMNMCFLTSYSVGGFFLG